MRSILRRQSSTYCANRDSTARAPTKCLRGRLLYSSTWRAICASSRASASAEFTRSAPDSGFARSGAGSGLAVSLAAAGAGVWAWVSSWRCLASSSLTFWRARFTSSPRSTSRVTGSGVFARRSSSVLPPPSRFDCASACASAGRVADLLFTRMTSSVSGGLRRRFASGNANRSDRTAAWTSTGGRIADCMAGVSRGGWLIQPPGPNRGCATADKVILKIPVNQKLKSIFSSHFSFNLWLLIDAPQVSVNQIDRRDLDFDRGPRRKLRQGRYPNIQRGAGDPDEILAHDLRGRDSRALLHQPAEAPVVLHLALELVVGRVGRLEVAHGAEQRLGAGRERRC